MFYDNEILVDKNTESEDTNKPWPRQHEIYSANILFDTIYGKEAKMLHTFPIMRSQQCPAIKKTFKRRNLILLRNMEQISYKDMTMRFWLIKEQDRKILLYLCRKNMMFIAQLFHKIDFTKRYDNGILVHKNTKSHFLGIWRGCKLLFTFSLKNPYL